MNIFATDHPMSGRPVRRRTKMIAAGIALFLIAAVGLFMWHINGARVVARAVAPDGTEFCVVQTCNWDFEFFTTSCYYRKPGGPWGWFYYDHEDWYWRRGRAKIDSVAKRISIYREGRVTVIFDWESERFRLLRTDFPQREFTGAQEWMPAGWSIAQKRNGRTRRWRRTAAPLSARRWAAIRAHRSRSTLRFRRQSLSFTFGDRRCTLGFAGCILYDTVVL